MANRKHDDATVAEVIRLYTDTSMTISEIAREVGLDRGQAHGILATRKQLGQRRPRRQLNADSNFVEPWAEYRARKRRERERQCALRPA